MVGNDMGANDSKNSSYKDLLLHLAQLAFVFWLTLSALVFISNKVLASSSQQNSGDLAVWITVHEMLKRGHVLYSEVWDHKDPGFFFLSQPLFEVLGIRGLYISAFLATVVFGVGVWLAIRPIVDWVAASVIALGATMYYSYLPSYFSTYVENKAFGFLALGLGLTHSYPMLAGVALALACTIKASCIVVVFLFCACVLLYRLFVVNLVFRLGRILIGYLAGVMCFGAFYWDKFDFSSWLEVCSFNREYAERRRTSPLKWHDVQDLFTITGTEIKWAIVVTLVSLAVGFSVLFWRRSKSLSTLATSLILATVAAFGGTCIQMIQYPPWIQHWQLLGGSWVFASCIGTAILFSSLPWYRLRTSLLGLLCIPILMHSPSAIQFVKWSRWNHLYEATNGRTNLRELIKGLPERTTFAIFGGNSYRLDFTEAPQSLRLACRIFFQFDGFDPRFTSEISACLDRKPDIVFLNNNHRPLLTAKSIARLKDEYSVCANPPGSYIIYGQGVDTCKKIQD